MARNRSTGEPPPREASERDLAAVVDEMLEKTGGPLTEAERRWADEILGRFEDAPK